VSTSSHWNEHARRWRHIGGPLRPCAADLEQVQRSLARHFGPHLVGARALLLGVTPELARLALPGDLTLAAFDQSLPMIEAVWPGDTERRSARVGDWFELNLPEGSVGIALGDGCFSLLDYPTGYRRLAVSLGRVLRSGGLFSIRVFCRPPQPEPLAALLETLLAREIGNFHAFKWRLAMSLQGDDIAQGVRVDRVWRTFVARLGTAAELAERLDWPVEEVQTIDNYRDSASVYTYSTVPELVQQLEPELELVEEWRGSYELAERCPQLLFRRR
jgi:SAM-dependent methyltransferase